MNLQASLALTHLTGMALLGACMLAGYQFAYRPAMDAHIQSVELRLRVQEQQDELQNMGPALKTSSIPEPQKTQETLESSSATNLHPMTPTAFLSTFERLAREIGLRVESSTELTTDAGTASDQAAPSIRKELEVEITGTGTFVHVVELCDSLAAWLPGVEIRRLQITRGSGDAVQWVMVCRNHNGPAD